jgi:hypothetical protein
MDTTTQGIEDFLKEAIENHVMENDLNLPRIRVISFEEGGVLSRNNGVMLQVVDAESEGAVEEFQISIVRSR